jgi:hypothetical protein
MLNRTFGKKATAAEMQRVRSLVERNGETTAARLLGVSRQTLARILARLPVSRGSHALVGNYFQAAKGA